MSLAQDFSVQLVRANNEKEISETIMKFVPRFCGFKISRVVIAENILTIFCLKDTDNGWSKNTTEDYLLETNLVTGVDSIGRKHFCGLGLVDLEIIKNTIGLTR